MRYMIKHFLLTLPLIRDTVPPPPSDDDDSDVERLPAFWTAGLLPLIRAWHDADMSQSTDRGSRALRTIIYEDVVRHALERFVAGGLKVSASSAPLHSGASTPNGATRDGSSFVDSQGNPRGGSKRTSNPLIDLRFDKFEPPQLDNFLADVAANAPAGGGSGAQQQQQPAASSSNNGKSLLGALRARTSSMNGSTQVQAPRIQANGTESAGLGLALPTSTRRPVAPAAPTAASFVDAQTRNATQQRETAANGDGAQPIPQTLAGSSYEDQATGLRPRPSDMSALSPSLFTNETAESFVSAREDGQSRPPTGVDAHGGAQSTSGEDTDAQTAREAPTSAEGGETDEEAEQAFQLDHDLTATVPASQRRPPRVDSGPTYTERTPVALQSEMMGEPYAVGDASMHASHRGHDELMDPRHGSEMTNGGDGVPSSSRASNSDANPDIYDPAQYLPPPTGSEEQHRATIAPVPVDLIARAGFLWPFGAPVHFWRGVPFERLAWGGFEVDVVGVRRSVFSNVRSLHSLWCRLSSR